MATRRGTHGLRRAAATAPRRRRAFSTLQWALFWLFTGLVVAGAYLGFIADRG